MITSNDLVPGLGSGAGSVLPRPVLIFAGACTLLAVVVAAMSILLHLKNYHKPLLQRMVIRIMLMVPIYAISSLISLFSLEAAFFIDAIRDVYEAFVIYCFFHLLLSYLGGERSLLILLHGRPPKIPAFPINLFVREIDLSDPYTFLFLKRGILQYVQVKPVLALTTMILKALGKFDEGNFRADSGYLYVSIVYNASICLALYCLAMFWMCVHQDLKPYRPVPKFLCVKGVLFFSFWQSIFISILVSARVIHSLGSHATPSQISLAITDLLTCAEMPLFAFFHLYAFAYTDYLSPHLSYVARMPVWYAFKDAFGAKDVVEEAKRTLLGKGMDYRQYEPIEGPIHQGIARDRRIRAGLRYSKGGQGKYWLPRMQREGDGLVMPRDAEVHAPLLQEQSYSVGRGPALQQRAEPTIWESPEEDGSGYELPFEDLTDANMACDEELYEHSKKYLFGDYNYPCVDVSTEHARKAMWDEEERVLRDERGAWFSSIRGARGRTAMEQRVGPVWEGYGAVGTHPVRAESRKAYPDGKVVAKHDVVIDHEHDRSPPASPGDVRLAWAKGKRKMADSAPRGEATPRNSSPSPSVGKTATPSGRPVSAPSSRSQAHGSRSPPHIAAREDAVDLVVHDPAMTAAPRERRTSELAAKGVAPGLRRVYSHSAEQNVPDDNRDRRHIPGTAAASPPDDGDRRDESEVSEAEEVTMTADPPPSYTLGYAENPWA